jgi:metal-responsive CopG/Arc/MetJ family transcriptional regulator
MPVLSVYLPQALLNRVQEAMSAGGSGFPATNARSAFIAQALEEHLAAREVAAAEQGTVSGLLDLSAQAISAVYRMRMSILRQTAGRQSAGRSAMISQPQPRQEVPT